MDNSEFQERMLAEFSKISNQITEVDNRLTGEIKGLKTDVSELKTNVGGINKKLDMMINSNLPQIIYAGIETNDKLDKLAEKLDNHIEENKINHEE